MVNMITVKMNNVDYRNRIEGGKITFNQPFGSIGNTEATLDIICTSEVEARSLFQKGAKVLIEDTNRTGDFLDGTKLFTGYIDKFNWDFVKKTLRIVVKDYLYLKNEVKTTGMIFVNKTIQEIITSIGNKIGITNFKFYPDALNAKTEYTIPVTIFDKDMSYIECLGKIVESLGGKCFISPGSDPHILVVEYGCLYSSYEETSTVFLQLQESEINSLSVEDLPQDKNFYEVKYKEKSIKDNVRVYLGVQDSSQAVTIPAGGKPTGDNKEIITFNDPVLKISKVHFSRTGVTIDATKFNANFESSPGYNGTDVDFTIASDKQKLKDPNNFDIGYISASGGTIWEWWMDGSVIIQNEKTKSAVDNSAGGDIKKWSLESSIIHNDEWAGKRGAWEAAKKNQKTSFDVAAFDKLIYTCPPYNVNSKPYYIIQINMINDADFYFIPESYNFDIGKMKWSFEGVTGRGTIPTPITGGITTPINEMPITRDVPVIPASISLTTIYRDGKAYVTSTFPKPSQANLKGFETRFSYDGTNYYNIGLSEDTTRTIEVLPNTTTYIQSRTVTIEGMKSDWSAAVSITSQKETAAPPVPGSISVLGGVGLISISWAKVQGKGYILQRSTTSDFSANLKSWTLVSNSYVDREVSYDTDYWYRVHSIDEYGNESADWVTSAGAVKTQKANFADIITDKITANDITAVLSLVVGQLIQAGNVKIGKDSSGNGYLEIGTETDTYYLKFDQGTGVFNLKANLYVGQGDNKIFFEDAGIRITDRSGTGDLATWKWVEFEDSRRTTNRFEFLFSQESDKSSRGQIVNYTSHGDLTGYNYFELKNAQNVDGSGASFIALGSKRASDAIPGNVTMTSIMTANGKAYANFNRAIRLESETADDQPNGSLLVDSAGNLKFKKGGTWYTVIIS